MTEKARSVSGGAVQGLLAGDDQFLPPEILLSDLTEAQAVAVPPGAPYSIAQLVAHLHFWQQRQIGWAQAQEQPDVADLETTFVPPQPDAWPQLTADFLAGIQTVGALAEECGAQPSTFYDDGTVGYGLASSALHNGYHLGQIVLLRRMQGFWPPAGGDGNW